MRQFASTTGTAAGDPSDPRFMPATSRGRASGVRRMPRRGRLLLFETTRARALALIAVAAVLVAGCSSDPTQSDAYLELDQQRVDLETQVSELEGELATIAADLSAMLESGGLDSVDDLTSEAADLDDRFTTLTSDLAQLESDLEDLGDSSHSLSTEVDGLRTQLAELQEMLRQVQEGDFS